MPAGASGGVDMALGRSGPGEPAPPISNQRRHFRPPRRARQPGRRGARRRAKPNAIGLRAPERQDGRGVNQSPVELWPGGGASAGMQLGYAPQRGKTDGNSTNHRWGSGQGAVPVMERD
ncbi:hypothetical protein NN561_002513 [Cricetulus griseus]